MSSVDHWIDPHLESLKEMAQSRKINLQKVIDLTGPMGFSDLPDLAEHLRRNGLRIELDSVEAIKETFSHFFLTRKRSQRQITMKEIGGFLSQKDLSDQMDKVYQVIEDLKLEIVPFLSESKPTSPAPKTQVEQKDHFEKELDEIHDQLDTLTKQFIVPEPSPTPTTLENFQKEAPKDPPPKIEPIPQVTLTPIIPHIPELETPFSIKPQAPVPEGLNQLDSPPPPKTPPANSSKEGDNNLFGIVRGAKIDTIMEELMVINARQGFITADHIRQARIEHNARYVKLAEILGQVKLKKLNLLNSSGSGPITEEQFNQEEGIEAFIPPPITQKAPGQLSSNLAPGVHLNLQSYNPDKPVSKEPDFWKHIKMVKEGQRETIQTGLASTGSHKSQSYAKKGILYGVSFAVIIFILSGAPAVYKNLFPPAPTFHKIEKGLTQKVEIQSDVKIILADPESFLEAPLTIEPVVLKAENALDLFKNVLEAGVAPFLGEKQKVSLNQILSQVEHLTKNGLMDPKGPEKLEISLDTLKRDAYQHMHGENLYKLEFYLKDYTHSVEEYFKIGKQVANPGVRGAEFKILGTPLELNLSEGARVFIGIRGRRLNARLESFKMENGEDGKIFYTRGKVLLSPEDYPFLNPNQHLPAKIETSLSRTLFSIPKRGIHFGSGGEIYVVDSQDRKIPIKLETEEGERSLIYSDHLIPPLEIKIPPLNSE